MSAKQLFNIIPLTAKEIGYLQSLAPVVKEHGVTVTTLMYQYMFKTYPEVKPFFNETNQKTGRQPKVLAFSLYQYILHLNDLKPISGFVNQIILKHCGLGILPDQYPIVGKCLVHAFQEALGPAADETFVTTLSKAYGNLAQTLINAEEEVYKTMQWRDFKDFKVARIEKESDSVTSVYLEPMDGTKLNSIIPGQYISMKWNVDGNEKNETLPREYSISSDLINNQYRISVKHLSDGIVSTYINTKLEVGDVVPVHAPVGTMTYCKSNKPKVAVLAGGIGITPMITIMEAALKDGKAVELFYSNHTLASQPFKETFTKWEAEFDGKFKLNEFISENNQHLETKDLETINSTNYDVYLLGPVGYMHKFKSYLQGNGVTDINMEFFGPTDPTV